MYFTLDNSIHFKINNKAYMSEIFNSLIASPAPNINVIFNIKWLKMKCDNSGAVDTISKKFKVLSCYKKKTG